MGIMSQLKMTGERRELRQAKAFFKQNHAKISKKNRVETLLVPKLMEEIYKSGLTTVHGKIPSKGN